MRTVVLENWSYLTAPSDRCISADPLNPIFDAGKAQDGNTQCLEFDSNRDSCRFWGAGDSSEYALGFAWVRIPTDGAPNTREFRILGFTDQEFLLHTGVAVKANLNLQVIKQTVELANSGSYYFPEDDAWHLVILKSYCHDTAGWAKVWVDGVLWIDATSIDTRALSYYGTHYVGLTIGGALSVAEDNLEVYIGECGMILEPDTTYDGLTNLRVHRQLPTGPGNSSDFTRVGGGSDNFEAVDDTTRDDDTTYLHSSTVGHKELFTFDAMPEASAVHSVQVCAMGKRSDAGQRTFKLLNRLSSVEDSDLENGMPTDEYMAIGSIFDLDPSSAAWSQSKVDSLESGVEVIT
jgi:hypothetical protein